MERCESNAGTTDIRPVSRWHCELYKFTYLLSEVCLVFLRGILYITKRRDQWYTEVHSLEIGLQYWLAEIGYV